MPVMLLRDFYVNNNNNRSLLYSAVLWRTQTHCALQHLQHVGEPFCNISVTVPCPHSFEDISVLELSVCVCLYICVFRTLGHFYICSFTDNSYTSSFAGPFLWLQRHWDICVLAASLGHFYACSSTRTNFISAAILGHSYGCSFTGSFLCLQLY